MNFTAVFVGDMLGEIGLLFSSVLVILSLSRVVSLMSVSVMVVDLSDPGRLWLWWSWTAGASVLPPLFCSLYQGSDVVCLG